MPLTDRRKAEMQIGLIAALVIAVVAILLYFTLASSSENPKSMYCMTIYNLIKPWSKSPNPLCEANTNLTVFHMSQEKIILDTFMDNRKEKAFFDDSTYGFIVPADAVVEKAAFGVAQATEIASGTREVVLYPQWNFISNPKNGPLVNNGGCQIGAIYGWIIDHYVSAQLNEVTGQRGFWIYNEGAQCTMHATGSDFEFQNLDLRAGWNIIGAGSSALNLNKIINNCVTTQYPYFYTCDDTCEEGKYPDTDPGYYYKTDKLVPGKAHWIKVDNDCTLSEGIPTCANNAEATHECMCGIQRISSGFCCNGAPAPLTCDVLVQVEMAAHIPQTKILVSGEQVIFDFTSDVQDAVKACVTPDCIMNILFSFTPHSYGIKFTNLSVIYTRYPVKEQLFLRIMECYRRSNYGTSSRSFTCEEFIIPPDAIIITPITEQSMTDYIVEKKWCHILNNADKSPACGTRDSLLFKEDITIPINVRISYDNQKKQIVVE